MKVRDLASGSVVEVDPQQPIRAAAKLMTDRKIGSVVVTEGGKLTGILTERDVLGAVAEGADLDGTAVRELMTTDVKTVPPHWEIYEAAVEMSAGNIRHLVVIDNGRVAGVLSMRDMLMASRRVELGDGNWAVVRSPLTFTVRERKTLHRQLLKFRDDPNDKHVDGLVELLVGSWSFEEPVPSDSDSLGEIPDRDYERLRDAVLTELPDLQRAVHPAPGWRRRR